VVQLKPGRFKFSTYSQGFPSGSKSDGTFFYGVKTPVQLNGVSQECILYHSPEENEFRGTFLSNEM
jgi:hypothetical protein